jgi:hypothetical protein
MEDNAGVRPGQLSYELLQAIHELYWYYELHENAKRCETIRLEYPAA